MNAETGKCRALRGIVFLVQLLTLPVPVRVIVWL